MAPFNIYKPNVNGVEMTGKKRLTRLISLVAFILFLPASYAHAGEFRVTPIRLDFEKGAKSGVISVSNEGEEGLNLQIKAMEWTQDGDGKDIYTETEDIIFYPKIMALQKEEKRVLRVGIKMPPPPREKTYRLFIEEIPEPKKKEEGMAVSIAVRFGAPIFIKPVKEDLSGEIAKVELSKGMLKALARNTGNSHFVINSVNIIGKNPAGQDVFTKEIAGWYLLAGASRSYSAEIPAETCPSVERVEVEVITAKFSFRGELKVSGEMCVR